MPKLIIENTHQLRAWLGQEVAVSDWLTVTQQMIDRFADVTGDDQWIHTDPERAARESPYGTTVAHGYLALALVPRLFADAIAMPNIRISINYGTNRVRFPAPLKAGSRVRGRFKLAGLEEIKGGAQITWAVTLEAEGSEKPVCVAEVVTRRYE
jgi:acyl dehydratase